MTKKQNALLSIFGLLIAALPFSVQAGPEDQAQTIHKRVTGVPGDAATLATMTGLVQSGNLKAAAEAALNGPRGSNFYDVVLPNVFTPFGNTDGLSTETLSDMIVTAIGMVRDQVDFRTALTGDALYASPLINRSYAVDENRHYEDLEEAIFDGDFSMGDPTAVVNIGQVGNAGIAAENTAGLMTTRGFAEAYYDMGTNRRAVFFVYKYFMCRDLNEIMDTTLPTDRIRRDVSRAPGGDSQEFKNTCKGCHSGMDAQGGAFARYDFRRRAITDAETDYCDGDTRIEPDGRLRCRSDHKMNRNFEFAPSGYITIDDSWVNLWANGANASLGWSSSVPTSGNGLRSWGNMIANSRAYSECMATHAFRQMTLRLDTAGDASTITNLASRFRSSNYNLRDLFLEAATVQQALGE